MPTAACPPAGRLLLLNAPVALLAAVGVALGVPRDTAADLHDAPLDLPGAALNDTSQEVGTSVGVAVVGTVIAVLLGSALPDGQWSPELVHAYFHAEQVAFLVVAAIVGAVSLYGAATLTDSRATDED